MCFRNKDVKKIGLAIGAAFAVGKLVQFGKEAIELGSDLQEVQNVVDVTFTTLSHKVDEFAKAAAATAGLSETMAKKYVGTFGAMSKSFGFTESAAYEMSTALTQLTGDVASFYNLSQDEAYTKLKSVFTGETESFKDLGVVMTQSALDAYAMANGFGKTTQAMTEQEKVALRYQFVMQQLAGASGDFVRTADGWANQVRVLKLQFDSLKATIGQGLINLLTPVIKVVNILIGRLATVANAFKAFTELITGKKSSSGGSGIAAANTAVSEISTGYSDAASNANDYGKATDKAAEATKNAAKAAKQYLSPLDEINKYTADSDVPVGNVGGELGGIGDIGSIEDAMADVDFGELAQGETVIDEVSDSMQNLIDKILGFAQVFRDAWDAEGLNTINAVKYALTEIGTLLGNIGSSFYEVWTNGTGVETLTLMLQIVQGIFGTVGGIAQRLSDAWVQSGVGTQIIQNLANWFNSILGFINGIVGATASWAANLNFYPLLESIANLTASFAPIADQIGASLLWLYQNAILPVATFLIEQALPFILNKISELLNYISENQWIIEAVGAALVTAFSASKLVPMITAIIKAVKMLINVLSVEGLISVMGSTISKIGVLVATMNGPLGIAIATVVAALVLLINHWDDVKTYMAGFIQWLRNLFVKDWTTIFGEGLGGAINGFFSSVKNFYSGIKRIFNGLITFFKGVFTLNWELAWEGIKEIFGGAFESLITLAKVPINAVIGLINDMIDSIETGLNWVIGGANKISFTVPSWVPAIGGNTWGINIPPVAFDRIPELATGTVIPPNASKFLAMLGDNNRETEVVSPLSTMKQAMLEALAESGGMGGGNYKFTAQINRRILFEEMIEEAKLRQDKTGENPFDLVRA